MEQVGDVFPHRLTWQDCHLLCGFSHLHNVVQKSPPSFLQTKLEVLQNLIDTGWWSVSKMVGPGTQSLWRKMRWDGLCQPRKEESDRDQTVRADCRQLHMGMEVTGFQWCQKTQKAKKPPSVFWGSQDGHWDKLLSEEVGVALVLVTREHDLFLIEIQDFTAYNPDLVCSLRSLDFQGYVTESQKHRITEVGSRVQHLGLGQLEAGCPGPCTRMVLILISLIQCSL